MVSSSPIPTITIRRGAEEDLMAKKVPAQLPRGLFGGLVVLPPAGLVAAQGDVTLMLHGSSGQVSINGTPDMVRVSALPGQTVRLRLINAVDSGMDYGLLSPARRAHVAAYACRRCPHMSPVITTRRVQRIPRFRRY
jgi:hypothetical protein